VRLLRREASPLPEAAWKDAEADWLRHFLGARMDLVLASMSAARSVTQLENGLAIFPRRAHIRLERPELFAELVDLCAAADPRIGPLLHALSVRLSPSTTPVWRLLFDLPWERLRRDGLPAGAGEADSGRVVARRMHGIARSSASKIKPWPEEKKLISTLAYRRRLHLAALGVLVPPEFLNPGAADEYAEVDQLGIAALAELANAANAMQLDSLLVSVNYVLLRRVAAVPLAREQLVIELSHGRLERLAATFNRKELLPLVDTVRIALGFLPKRARQQLTDDVLGPRPD
jgi:hypothetical protein